MTTILHVPCSGRNLECTDIANAILGVTLNRSFQLYVVKDVSFNTIQTDFEKLQYKNEPIMMRTKVKDALQV